MRRLLIRPGAIGDCLCSLPALWLLQTAETEIWTNGAVAPLVGFGTKVRSLAGSGFSLLGLPAEVPADLLHRLRRFDEILSWAGQSQPEVQDHAARLKLPIRFFPALPASADRLHVSDWMIGQSRPWQRQPGWRELDAEPTAWREPGGRRFLLAIPDTSRPRRPLPQVVLHPFSGSPRKNWPLERFERLARELAGDCEVRWCAGPDDPLPASYREGALLHTDLRSLAEALQQATLYVGNDSGITHLSAMLGIPTLAFFGPMEPEVWAPRGAIVHIVRTPHSGQATSEIPYAEALSRVRAALYLTS